MTADKVATICDHEKNYLPFYLMFVRCQFAAFVTRSPAPSRWPTARRRTA